MGMHRLLSSATQLEFVAFSTCLTVSREMESVYSSFTDSSASNRKLQLVCASGAALQATARLERLPSFPIEFTPLSTGCREVH